MHIYAYKERIVEINFLKKYISNEQTVSYIFDLFSHKNLPAVLSQLLQYFRPRSPWKILFKIMWYDIFPYPSVKYLTTLSYNVDIMLWLYTRVYLRTKYERFETVRLRAPLANSHSNPLEGIEILRLRASRIDLFVRNFHSAGTRKSHAESSIKRTRVRTCATTNTVLHAKRSFITIAVNNPPSNTLSTGIICCSDFGENQIEKLHFARTNWNGTSMRNLCLQISLPSCA